MHKLFGVLGVAAALAGSANAANAQSCSIASTQATVSCTVGTTVSMTMPSLMNLSLTSTSVALNTPMAVTDFDAAGLYNVNTAGPNFQVKSNRSYRVQVAADAANFSHTPVTGAAAYGKPAGDVSWSTDASSFTALTSTPADIGSGTATALSPAKLVTYKTHYDITKDQPGAYSLGVTFTLVAP